MPMPSRMTTPRSEKSAKRCFNSSKLIFRYTTRPMSDRWSIAGSL